jgi:hypothetical protein
MALIPEPALLICRGVLMAFQEMNDVTTGRKCRGAHLGRFVNRMFAAQV